MAQQTIDTYKLTSMENLSYLYESAKERMAFHPEHTDKCQKSVLRCPRFEDIRDALKIAIKFYKDGKYPIMVWTKIDKYEDSYHLQNFWLVTDDGDTLKAAEYIGMFPLHDVFFIPHIVHDNISIEDIDVYK